MLILDKNKSTEVSFNFEISGNKATPIANLVIVLDGNLKLHIPGTIEDEIIKFTIPPVGKFFEETEGNKHEALMEVRADSNFFTPWKGDITLKESVKIKAEPTITEEKEVLEEKKIIVKSNPIIKSKKKIIKENKVVPKKPKKKIVKENKISDKKFNEVSSFFESLDIG